MVCNRLSTFKSTLLWLAIDGVHVPVWYNSLQLSTQEEIRIHHKTNYENPTGNYFQNDKRDSDDNIVEDIEFNNDSDFQ